MIATKRTSVVSMAALASFGMLAAGAGAAADKAAAPDRVATERIVREYLLEHPEVIREAVAVLKQREAAAEAAARKGVLATHRDELVADPSSPQLGNPAGDVTVVEFFDYRCGYCRRVAPEVAELLASDTKVRLVLKELPILGPESLAAAKGALAAHRQGRYADFHRALMQEPGVDATSIEAVAARIGLDMDKFHADSEDAATRASLEKNQRLASALGINGTPAFVIGDRLVPGAADAATLAGHVAAVRAAN